MDQHPIHVFINKQKYDLGDAIQTARVFATPAAEPPAFRTAGRLDAIVRNSAQTKAIASVDIISTLDYGSPHGVRRDRN